MLAFRGHGIHPTTQWPQGRSWPRCVVFPSGTARDAWSAIFNDDGDKEHVKYLRPHFVRAGLLLAQGGAAPLAPEVSDHLERRFRWSLHPLHPSAALRGRGYPGVPAYLSRSFHKFPQTPRPAK